MFEKIQRVSSVGVTVFTRIPKLNLDFSSGLKRGGSDLAGRERLKIQLRRSWDFIPQQFVEERVTLFESSPGSG
jgi:hypothetical protein